MINYNVPMNNRGNNANLVANVLDDITMTANGFRRTKDYWYYVEDLGCEITLRIQVPPLTIDVIDEEFLQPYDYQAMLRMGSGFALKVHRKVQNTMKKLSDTGIIEGWVSNDYI